MGQQVLALGGARREADRPADAVVVDEAAQRVPPAAADVEHPARRRRAGPAREGVDLGVEGVLERCLLPAGRPPPGRVHQRGAEPQAVEVVRDVVVLREPPWWTHRGAGAARVEVARAHGHGPHLRRRPLLEDHAVEGLLPKPEHGFADGEVLLEGPRHLLADHGAGPRRGRRARPGSTPGTCARTGRCGRGSRRAGSASPSPGQARRARPASTRGRSRCG